MNWQSRLEKTVIALNLIGLALGFGTFGILILVKGEHGVNPGSTESLASSWVHYFCCLHFTSANIPGGGGSGRSGFVREWITSCRTTEPTYLG